MNRALVLLLAPLAVRGHVCPASYDGGCHEHLHEHGAAFEAVNFTALADVDSTCEELSDAGGVMFARSCSPGSCVAVDNPNCDDVTWTEDPNTLEYTCSSPTTAIFDLWDAEFASPNNACQASTAGICGDLEGFFSLFNHSFIGAYCTDTFLVLWTHGLYNSGSTTCADYTAHLRDVPQPPGVSYQRDRDQYADQCVGRTARPQIQVFKVPLTPASWLETPLVFDSSFFPASAVGVVFDGLPLYPALDASFLTVWDACESSLCNTHDGMGLDLHHHGNPIGEECFYQNMTAPWYDGEDPHATPTGLSSDGYYIYGQYPTASQAQPALDDCGGHNHSVSNAWDSSDYHYHAYTKFGTDVAETGSGDVYYFFSGPSNCWRGDVNEVENFFEDGSTKLNYDASGQCAIDHRNDYQQIRPCSDSSATMYNPGSAIQPCQWF